jgi:predicted component of type VI protein secretion system
LSLKSRAGVQLILQKGQGPSQIELFTGVNILGRAPDKVDHLIQDNSVSSIHCHIVQVDGSSKFRVCNVSRFGTRVNQRPVDDSGWLLQPGDVIEMGRVSYRYEPVVKQEAGRRGGDDLTDDIFQMANSRRR